MVLKVKLTLAALDFVTAQRSDTDQVGIPPVGDL